MRHSLTPFYLPLTGTRGRIYISGQMTGTGVEQQKRFHDVAESLREGGYSVCNPYETSEILGELEHPQYLRFDFQRVLEADFIIALTGWEKSLGARAELHMALNMGLPVWESEGVDDDHLGQLSLVDVTQAIACA